MHPQENAPTPLDPQPEIARALNLHMQLARLARKRRRVARRAGIKLGELRKILSGEHANPNPDVVARIADAIANEGGKK